MRDPAHVRTPIEFETRPAAVLRCVVRARSAEAPERGRAWPRARAGAGARAWRCTRQCAVTGIPIPYAIA